jgi:phenylalanyl-tRNA synthetase alpha chain
LNWEEKIDTASDLDALESVRGELFGKKGYFPGQFAKMKSVPNEEKKAFANSLNSEKATLEKALINKKIALETAALEARINAEKMDASLFSHINTSGAVHPVMQTMDEIIEYFNSMNFEMHTGPMVEDDFHNFEALNLSTFHPAREMQDTFYFADEKLLRTHTSPVQIRAMKHMKPPFKMIAPGAVFRRDYDLTHTPMFHQVEGLVVDKEGKVSFAHLKFILEHFLMHFFGDVDVRFRPSFFPFTEPSAEVDISCIFCSGKGCRVCSKTGWLEVLGCGMVDPNVFKAVGYEEVSGYAFGLGVERFAMLKRHISDLRSLYEGDIDLLEQFV